MSVRIFVVTLQGVEAAGAPPLTVLAFTRADDDAAAEQAAAGELARLGWGDVRALRAGEVTDAAALPEDFVAAFADAVRHGCALIVYEEP